MMLPDIFNVINKARYSGINGGPKTVPTLYQRSAKAFVSELHRRGNYSTRIRELHELPAVVLSSILDEMTFYPSLRGVLHRELSDPVLFMRMFTYHGTDRLVLENCLRNASLIGKPVLPDLAKNWCKMMDKMTFQADSSCILKNVINSLKLGMYLHEAGWSLQSMEVCKIVLRMISQEKSIPNQEILKIVCVQNILRAEGSAQLKEQADATCSTLLTMIKGVTENDVLLRVYLEVANHNFKAHRVAESHRWTTKAMELMTESTPLECIIEILQLEALYLFNSQRHDDGSLVISQAIHRARSTYGHLHRRYADTLYTYGVCLLKTNSISDAIPILLELLDVITKLYGKYTPHVAIIQSYLAYGFYRRSQSTGRFDMAVDHIQKAIVLAKQIMPERQKVIEHFCHIRAMILKGRDEALDGMADHRAARLSDFQIYTVTEIKQKCLEQHDA